MIISSEVALHLLLLGRKVELDQVHGLVLVPAPGWPRRTALDPLLAALMLRAELGAEASEGDGLDLLTLARLVAAEAAAVDRARELQVLRRKFREDEQREHCGFISEPRWRAMVFGRAL
ncbi:hypothetical protein [Aromatoleum aromaticum]|uniref:hypothetical protein n=1 Tax=Aromatoleum aromaticum TaxID=551760 RepID=UPI00059FA958|nr:hypothetical protein [Aromatoleum aromaticum]NMG55386.1 hypothetical protein [Aromatoleum aromaticum]